MTTKYGPHFSPEEATQIAWEFHNAEQLGPLASRYAAAGWESATTTAILVRDDEAFRTFLDSHDVVYAETNGAFLLYIGAGSLWPMANEEDTSYKDGFHNLDCYEEDMDDDGQPYDPHWFWRQVVTFMQSSTYFRVMHIGFTGYWPINLDRETNYYALAITVQASGEIFVQDFENHLIKIKQ